MDDIAKESLGERICKRILSDPSAPKSQKNRAAFLAYRDEIEAALADGWSILAVWRMMSDDGRITFTYQSFRKYVNRLIYKRPKAIQASTPKAKSDDGISSSRSVISDGFVFERLDKSELV